MWRVQAFCRPQRVMSRPNWSGFISAREEQEQFDELTAWTLGRGDSAFLHQHVVDAWAAQHAAEGTKPITVAFALIGLYLHLEKGYTGREVQRVHMKLAQPLGRGGGRKHWPQFEIPRVRGTVTAVDVMSSPQSERAKQIERWCRSVWEAWSDSHDAVREWAKPELMDRV